VIVTADEMRTAEAQAIAAGTPAEELMERAGQGAAEAIWRFAGPLPALVLCGPGNNGGDGYVIARVLRERGLAVRVAALGEPTTPAARQARERWGGAVEPLGDDRPPAPLLIDALFGTGLKRGLATAAAAALLRLAAGAQVRVAIDLPSGAATDDGALLSPVPDFELIVTFAALKPSHLLQPAARHMGRIATVDIGVEARSRLSRIARPMLPAPGPDDHKYTRGFVGLIAGEMPGAIALAAAAAARAGAGYVQLFASAAVAGVPSAVVQGRQGGDLSRAGCLVLGPGLGRGEEARARVAEALATGKPLVLDADAPFLVGGGVEGLRTAGQVPILTPHDGEFVRLFGDLRGSKVERARAAARRSGAVVVLKGPDTVVAAPDGRAAIAAATTHWPASAGTGDVLAGVIGAMRARGLEAFEAACAGVWLHGRAAELAGAGMIADDLLRELPRALGECSG